MKTLSFIMWSSWGCSQDYGKQSNSPPNVKHSHCQPTQLPVTLKSEQQKWQQNKQQMVTLNKCWGKKERLNKCIDLWIPMAQNKRRLSYVHEHVILYIPTASLSKRLRIWLNSLHETRNKRGFGDSLIWAVALEMKSMGGCHTRLFWPHYTVMKTIKKTIKRVAKKHEQERLPLSRSKVTVFNNGAPSMSPVSVTS